jgi:hypothetical protein
VTRTEDGLVIGVLLMALAVVILVAVLSILIIREKCGQHVFSPLLSNADM